MSTALPLHSAPAAGFDQPFELLAACHARMERTLALLERLGAHLDAHGGDDSARSAAGDVLRYFDIAAPLHHQDEELHVLSRLRARGQASLAAQLRVEHQVMEQEWAQLRPDLLAVQDGTLTADALAAARARWSGFAALYRGHLEAEDQRAYPVARQDLPVPMERAMGEEMARRRGAAPPPRTGDGQG